MVALPNCGSNPNSVRIYGFDDGKKLRCPIFKFNLNKI
jgi:hypothetical protein